MRKIGRVVEVWRYPVSSVSGEMPGVVDVSPAGIAGDRRFGIFDHATGRPAAPEQEPRWRPALYLSSAQSDDPLPTLSFPDSGPFSLDDPSLTERLTSYFGFAVGVATHPGPAGGPDWLFPIIPGRYAASPLHLVTTASLAALATVAGVPSVDSRRFRPSLLIDTDEEGFVENGWLGQTMTIGPVEIKVNERTRRCGMTLVAQPGLNEEPHLLRSIMRHNARSLGVYADLLGTGTIAVGDAVYANS